jgi:CHAD domain-containing protein
VIAARIARAPAVSDAARGKLVLAPALPVKVALAAAMTDLLAYAARRAATAARDPVGAVHEVRKSMRRARALLAVVRAALPTETFDRLEAGLQRIQARASALRDVDVLLPALVALGAERALAPEARRALGDLARVLREERRRARGSGAAQRALGGIAHPLATTDRAFARALPDDLSRADLRDGARAIYRRARRALRRARHAPGDDQRFHTWRKRTKSVNYALELVASSGGRHAKHAHERYADLAKRQGEVTDLVLVRDRLRTWAAGRADAAPAPLLAELDARIARERRAVERQGRSAFERAPRAFAAHVF